MAPFHITAHGQVSCGLLITDARRDTTAPNENAKCLLVREISIRILKLYFYPIFFY